MDNILSLIGLAKKAGRLEIGEEPVGAACRSRHARIVILASDAAENTVRRAAHFSDAGKVRSLPIPLTKAELGSIVGRSSCAMMAVTDTGFAASLVKKLAAIDPETYGSVAEQLGGKAEKVLQRQREMQAHEKKLQRGLKRPWAPPTNKK